MAENVTFLLAVDTTNRTEQQGVMELDSIRRGFNAVIPNQNAYLVEMAKAEAMDQMGEKRRR